MTDDQHDQLSLAASPAQGRVEDAADIQPDGEPSTDETGSIGEPSVRTGAKRRRGSRGGRNRKKPSAAGAAGSDDGFDGDDDNESDDDGDTDELTTPESNGHRAEPATTLSSDLAPGDGNGEVELPKRIAEGRATGAAAERALVRKPQIGDTRPAPPGPAAAPAAAAVKPAQQRGERTRNDRQKSDKPKADRPAQPAVALSADDQAAADAAKKKRRRGVKGPKPASVGGGLEVDLDADTIERRRGRERNGRPIGRYLMAVQVRPSLTQVAVLEGRNLIEHYVSRPADDVSQIHGNIYLGKVQNVLPGMEAAFVDIGTPKNAVLYRGDVQYDPEDIVEKSGQMRIEQMLRPKQLVLCQVTKNPISAKGARLTQEVSLPGRFVVLIPNSKTYGISKRLPDDVRKRLRNILDRVKPAQHGLIVRTAAENANEHELRADMTRLLEQWSAIEAKAKKANSPTLLYREPELAVRVIREEFNAEYRGVIIDDQRLFEDVRDYVAAFNPDLADRIEYFDAASEGLPLYERQHIHEQLHKALDRKVWLPSGGSLIIEHTEALTVIDVNTGKNVGTSNLEETVFRNNLEAAEEVAKQLRLRDIGGIVVIDFIDLEIKDNRRKVVDAFRSALARDKTRTQVFDITDLGLVEMTRKRIGEGLLVNFADQCPNCDGRGVLIDHALLE
ncbi:MAG TPA: Rne/Rng family ribonuclease [Ilumatobacteraceae bacterium]|nr:Rne/Rng family ribonuclease [Ilumatobacteraceae bacterium]